MPTISRILLPLAAATLCAGAFADPDIVSGDAVKIVFTTDLRANINRPGDGFYVVTDRDPLLPDGTRLYGRILSVHMATWRRPASMDLVFYAMRTPDGQRRRIEAVPMALNDPHLTRGTNGRLVARYTPGDSAAYTAGGALGGLIIGGIAHRPILGTVLGAFIGSLAGAADQRENQDLVVSKGEHMAAVFTEEANGAGSALPPPPPPGGPSGWHTGEGHHHHDRAVDQGLEIRSDNLLLSYDPASAPFEEGGDVLVPLEQTAIQLKLDVTRHSDGRIGLDGPDGSVELAIGTSSYHTDDHRSGSLPHVALDRDGTIFVPIEAFTLVTSTPILVNGHRIGGG